MKISIIEEKNLDIWEKDLKTLSGSLFHSSLWLESIRTPRIIPIYIKFISNDDKLIGLIGGISVEPFIPIFNKFFRAIYFFSGPSVVQFKKDILKKCIVELINWAKIKNYTHIFIKSFNYPHLIDFKDLPINQEIREEYIINLNLDMKDIQKRMRKSIIEQTRKAMRSGLKFYESNSADIIEKLIYLLEETKSIRILKGYEEYSYYYIHFLNKEILMRLFKNKIGRIFYVESDSEIICILYCLVYNKTAYALLIGANNEAYKLRAPAFIWYHTIEKLKQEGFKYLNLGGIPNDSSRKNLTFAKTSLGGEKYLCYGGNTPHLRGNFFDLFNNFYRKFQNNRIKNIVVKLILGNA